MRRLHRDGEVVLPNDFIPLAEETGLIVEMGEWAIDRACRDAKDLWDHGFAITVSVNLSPRQFRQEGFVEKVSSVLARTGLAPEALIFELTEGTVMENEEKAIALLTRLKDLGVGLAIDDFGTGYSSLYYLKQLPIDELKIDRRFIRDVAYDGEDTAIATAIITLGKSLKLRVVAEGVETRDQLAYLLSQGCDHMQGYLFSKPVSLIDLSKMLADAGGMDLPHIRGQQRNLPF
jgi:EAL domain-containing protein (putative c-di-GMP-specific phosphodiesterase class I)